MSEEQHLETDETEERTEVMQQRREFLRGLGKWSSAAMMAAVGGAAWISSRGTAQAAGWLNRRSGAGWINRGGGWLNRGGGGAGWINRRGGGGWLNRR